MTLAAGGGSEDRSEGGGQLGGGGGGGDGGLPGWVGTPLRSKLRCDNKVITPVLVTARRGSVYTGCPVLRDIDQLRLF